MNIYLNEKLMQDIKKEPERFNFKIVNNNLVLFCDNVATNNIFAIPQTSRRRISYIKSYKIEQNEIVIKTVSI